MCDQCDVEPMKIEEQDGRPKREDVCPSKKGKLDLDSVRERIDAAIAHEPLKRPVRNTGAASKSLPAAPLSRKRCTANFPRALPSGLIPFRAADS